MTVNFNPHIFEDSMLIENNLQFVDESSTVSEKSELISLSEKCRT